MFKSTVPYEAISKEAYLRDLGINHIDAYVCIFIRHTWQGHNTPVKMITKWVINDE